jgi:hypothetical protein
MASAEKSRSVQATDKRVNNGSNSFFFIFIFTDSLRREIAAIMKA